MVLSGTDLKELFKPKTAGIPNVGLEAVAWSDDGRFLYAGGFWVIDNVRQVRRWSDSGRGAFVDIPGARNTVMQVIALKTDAAMLFASTAILA